MSVPYVKTEVGLNSCTGRWAGCIPGDAPALVYHHGARLLQVTALRDAQADGRAAYQATRLPLCTTTVRILLPAE
jgi:hypothetical protein